MYADNKHWTENSLEDKQISLAFDFVDQLLLPLQDQNVQQKELAERLGVSKGRVSQLINRPGNLTLRSLAHWTRPLDMDVSIVVYPKDNNDASPVSGQIFRHCWEYLGKPRSFFDLEDIEEKNLYSIIWKETRSVDTQCKRKHTEPLTGNKPSIHNLSLENEDYNADSEFEYALAS